MRNIHSKATVCNVPASVATNATQALSFDTAGFDFANVKVLCSTNATTSAAFSTLKFTESDTVTSASSMDAIVALTGGTATSTSVGFVIPTTTITGGGVAAEFQLDLRKRKRYLGIQSTPGQALTVGVVGTLVGEESADSTTEKSESNLAATSVTGCGKIVQV